VEYQYLADRAGTIKVVTHSWGGCLSLSDPAVIAADENAFAQAAAGGQAWFVATGDTGSNGCNGAGGINPDVGYPAASAYVTAVGGSEQNHSTAGTFGADGWITGYPASGEAACSNGGGGEATAGTLGPRPSWQSGTGVTGTYRLVPDVSLHYGTCGAPGAGKPYLAMLGGTLLGVGGTSGSAPEWAGFWAVANQVVGTNLGHAAPTLFRILRNEGGTSYANSFHDITTGNNGAYPAGAGFDKATGIGTPKFNGLYPALQTLFTPANSGCFTDTTQADFQAGTPTNVNATFSPGDLRLAITAGGQALNAQNTNVSNSAVPITTTQWIGQDFVATATGTLSKVEIALLCNGCSGSNPDITVDLRSTNAGGVPLGVLATTTIPGFASPAGIVYYTATFASPAAVTSGTTYAIITRLAANRSAGSYLALISASDVYGAAPGIFSPDSGANWGLLPNNADLGFKTYITTTPSYAGSGDFIAGVNDSNPSGSGTPHISSLSWTASTPANTTVKFQLATSVSETGPFNFIGPDGTAATFFTTTPVTPAAEKFQGRYFQWRAFLSTTNSAATPVLNDVTVCYNNTCAGLPSAPASASNNGPICAGATLQLNAATVSGATYSWTGPNGFTSALQNPTISNAQAAATGTYNVKAIIGACQSANVPTSATVTATGGACNDGNACTQTDTCQAGACAGGNPVVCPSDNCHNAGICNPANGACSAGTTKYNTACDDGNPCTSGDTCGMRLVENFDQTGVPAIPGTWTTTLVAGNPGDKPYVTVSSSSHTTPVSAFTDDLGHVTDKVLISPSFTVTSSPGQAYVSFFQRYQLESGFDGGVLEISINGGAYNDILAAGGSFVTGGYNAPISTAHANPIGGRQAWTGSSAGYPGYIQTTANLPAAAAGQSVRLKWRVATDNSVPSTGQNLDSIRVVDDFPAMTCVGQAGAGPPGSRDHHRRSGQDHLHLPGGARGGRLRRHTRAHHRPSGRTRRRRRGLRRLPRRYVVLRRDFSARGERVLVHRARQELVQRRFVGDAEQRHAEHHDDLSVDRFGH
jgi:hypothetical protein